MVSALPELSEGAVRAKTASCAISRIAAWACSRTLQLNDTMKVADCLTSDDAALDCRRGPSDAKKRLR